MTRRELVKAAIAHQTTSQAPYLFDLWSETWQGLAPSMGGLPCEQYLGNDVLDIEVPWWNWHDLPADWHGPGLNLSRWVPRDGQTACRTCPYDRAAWSGLYPLAERELLRSSGGNENVPLP